MSGKNKGAVSNENAFNEGSIVRIKLENVLTYDSVEFKCGPFLNVVIGPNGTGKSTIVCAICLGLAGKTSWLGRAQQASEYIKYGKDKAVIELELHNSAGENYIIKREILKNNTSHWSVNGRSAQLRTVEELVGRLKIQVGNLCQFLPQEKVADFAKMTQQELLENTEKAVATNDMYENHQKLKEDRSGSRNMELSYTNLKDRLEQEIQKNSRLEQEVKNYEERQKHLQRIKLLEMKKPWVEYEEQRQVYFREKTERETMSEELKKAQREFLPLQKKKEEAEDKVKRLHGEMCKLVDEVREYAKQAHDKSKEIDAESDKMQEVNDDLKFKLQEENNRKKLLHDLKRQLGALENELQEAASNSGEDVQPAIERVIQEVRQINQKMTQNQHQANTIQGEVENTRAEVNEFKRELQGLQNVSNKRLELLRHRHRHTYDAVQWLRANAHRFKARIHEPMLLTLNVLNPKDAKYIESHISFNDLRAFVCEEAEDLNLFMDLMRDEQKLRVNAIRMPSQSVSSFRPAYDINQFRRYDFQCYLKDTIECPDAVMRYLCLQYHVHSIMIGTDQTKSMVEKVIQENPRLSSFYTANHSYSIKRSKYDGELARRNTQLKNPSLLTVSLDTQRITALQNNIQRFEGSLREKEDSYNQLQQSSKDLEKRLNQLRNEKKELSQVKEKRRILQTQIETKKKNISRKESEGLDLDLERKKAGDKLRQLCIKKCQHLQVLKKQTQHCFELGLSRVRVSLEHAVCQKQTTDYAQQISDQSQALQNLERRNAEMKENLKQTKEKAKRLLEKAKKTTDTGPNEDLSTELKKSFEEIPSTVEEIDALIHEQRVRADCKFQTDERVVQDFNDRKKSIDKMQKELLKKKHLLDNHQAEIERIKEAWITPLKDLIARINDNFGYFFKSLNCAGEVDLNVPENAEDYEKYGIRIKVKYRDTEPLRELTPHHQSGGERSVATVLYMMALQELTVCPFRCVDEINQGMDPINERKVFELVVHTVCKKNSSQYFLLTPKLLPDLDYADNMRVLCVYNGPQMMNHTEWKLKKFIKRRARLEQEAG